MQLARRINGVKIKIKGIEVQQKAEKRIVVFPQLSDQGVRVLDLYD